MTFSKSLKNLLSKDNHIVLNEFVIKFYDSGGKKYLGTVIVSLLTLSLAVILSLLLLVETFQHS